MRDGAPSITAGDRLRVMRLIADVAALRADPVRQRQRLIDGVNRMIRATAGWLYAVDDYRPGRAIRYRAQILTSDPDPDWVRYITEFGVRQPITADPYAVAVLHCPRRHQVWTMGAVLPDDTTRERYAAVVELMRVTGTRDGILAVARVGPRGDDIVGFTLHCMRGAEPLGTRGRSLARLAIGEVARLVESGVLSFGPAADAALPPRLQQMLVRLMEGRSPKEIAHQLGLSVHTVREHIQRLYERHSVSNRDDLMAKFISGEPPSST